MTAPVVRFAPSPTGHLHLGNARVAVVNWLFARRHGGRFLLRIDDTDRDRSETAYEQAIQEDLTWLGLGWDGDLRQSSRGPVYEAAFARLRDAGRVYACYETAEELASLRQAQQARGAPIRYERRALEAAGRRPYPRWLRCTLGIAWLGVVGLLARLEGLRYVGEQVLPWQPWLVGLGGIVLAAAATRRSPPWRACAVTPTTRHRAAHPGPAHPLERFSRRGPALGARRSLPSGTYRYRRALAQAG